MPLSPDILPDPYRPPTREQIERARDMYAQGFTVARILAACDMSLGTLYYWLSGGPREADGPLYPPLPRRRLVAGKRRAPLPADRVSLVARLWRTTERQARDIEERLARPGGATPARERDLRMLAMLTRTLRELAAFDSGAAPESERARDAPALAQARDTLARRQAWREAEQRAGTVRHMARYLRDIARIEALQAARAAGQAQAAEDKAKAAADTAARRGELVRRIEGFIAARQAQEPAGQ